MNLNVAQERAIEHFDGPCLVLAGPGSGKTAVLTRRINRLIEKKVLPQEICVITFTKAAAMEMKQRFNDMSKEPQPVTFGTFHSLFWGILSQELKLTKDNILLDSRKFAVLKEAVNGLEIQSSDKDILSQLSTEISYINNAGIDIESYNSSLLNTEDVKKAYGKYDSLKKKYHLYDFDDMLLRAEELFNEHPDVLAKWQGRFSYFLVDEMQDMNDIQFRLISKLSNRTKNIFCVGDDDQSIYGFRGANPEVMSQFEASYENCQKILLDTNYRCPKNVLKAAISSINHNENRYSKEIKATKEDGLIEINSYETSKDEADAIVQKIIELKEGGTDLENIAVLYRNHSVCNYLVDGLINVKIPFYLKEQMPNIYSHFIIEDMENFFQIAIGNATRQRMLSIMNKPNHFFSRSCLDFGYSFQDMWRFYEDNMYMQQRVKELETDLELIKKMTPFAAVNYILKGMGYINYMKEKALSKDVELKEYLEVVEFFQEIVRETKTIKKAIEKIDYLKLKVDYENRNRRPDKSQKVGLYTLHSCKGLEFDHVFLMGVNEGVIPTKKAKSKADIEAERRLFYVGATRTKKCLYISSVKEKNRDRAYPSRFINELNINDYSS